MPFVQMKDSRLNPQSLQQTHAADTKHDFLHHPRFSIAAIKMPGYEAIRFVVFRNIRVQQIEPHSADIGAPCARAHRAATNRDLDDQRLAVFGFQRMDWEFVCTRLAIPFLLKTIAAQTLSKITKA